MYKGFSKMKLIISLVIALFITATLIGCQKFIKIKAEIQNDILLFVFSNKPVNAIVKIYDIELYKIDCQDKCIMWQVINKTGTNGKVTYAEVEKNYIEYGQNFSEMDLRVPPKTLVPGKYTATGTASVKKEGGRLFAIEFELKLDKNGKLAIKSNSAP